MRTVGIHRLWRLALLAAIVAIGAWGVRRLAIYLTDPAAPWLALAFGLRTIGLPFVVTADARMAAYAWC